MMVSDPISPDSTEEIQPSIQASETTWKKVHPASIFINLVPQLIRILRGLWLILLFFFFKVLNVASQLAY